MWERGRNLIIHSHMLNKREFQFLHDDLSRQRWQNHSKLMLNSANNCEPQKTWVSKIEKVQTDIRSEKSGIFLSEKKNP